MTSLKKSKELLDLAEKKIADGAVNVAADLIQEAVSFCPRDPSIYGDAVNLLLEAGLFKSAKNMFKKYHQGTGKELVSDFTLDDILQMEKTNDFSSPSGYLVFKRMSLRKRGHFSNVFSFSPIKEIGLSANSIYIVQGGKKYVFSWKEVLSAQLLKKNALKSYGMGTAAKFIQKTFIIETKEKLFQFDVSSNFPDFEYSNQLLKELLKKLKVQDVDERK